MRRVRLCFKDMLNKDITKKLVALPSNHPDDEDCDILDTCNQRNFLIPHSMDTVDHSMLIYLEIESNKIIEDLLQKISICVEHSIKKR